MDKGIEQQLEEIYGGGHPGLSTRAERPREPCREPTTNRYHPEWCDPVECLRRCPDQCWCRKHRDEKLGAKPKRPKKEPLRPLTEKERRFVEHYARQSMVPDAMRAAGYIRVDYSILDRPPVRAALAKLRKELDGPNDPAT